MSDVTVKVCINSRIKPANDLVTGLKYHHHRFPKDDELTKQWTHYCKQEVEYGSESGCKHLHIILDVCFTWCRLAGVIH